MLFASGSNAQYKTPQRTRFSDILKIARKVMSEVPRMLGLIRFQLAADGYFALLLPTTFYG